MGRELKRRGGWGEGGACLDTSCGVLRVQGGTVGVGGGTEGRKKRGCGVRRVQQRQGGATGHPPDTHSKPPVAMRGARLRTPMRRREPPSVVQLPFFSSASHQRRCGAVRGPLVCFTCVCATHKAASAQGAPLSRCFSFLWFSGQGFASFGGTRRDRVQVPLQVSVEKRGEKVV